MLAKLNDVSLGLRKMLVESINRHEINTISLDEYLMAFYNGRETEDSEHPWRRRHVFDQSELKLLYDRYGQSSGATKACHIRHESGNDFSYIVVKRFSVHGRLWSENKRLGRTGNQVIDEFLFWQKVAETPDARFFCPALRIYTTKSDNNDPRGKKAMDNVVLISMKASHISDWKSACYKAAERNSYNSTWAERIYDEGLRVFNKYGMRDVNGHPANSGIIYDNISGEYRPVCIDYAL